MTRACAAGARAPTGALACAACASLGDDELPSSARPGRHRLRRDGVPARACPRRRPRSPRRRRPRSGPPPPTPADRRSLRACSAAGRRTTRTAARPCAGRRAPIAARAKRLYAAGPARARALRDHPARRHGTRSLPDALRPHARPRHGARREGHRERQGRADVPCAGLRRVEGPAARRYLVKQSLRPIRTAADFGARPRCAEGSCAFPPSRSARSSRSRHATCAAARRTTTRSPHATTSRADRPALQLVSAKTK